MRTLMLICLIIGSGFVSSHREKRHVVQLNKMIACLTGRSGLKYMSYGCWCGIGGGGSPVDATDRCCREHDWCYDRLVRDRVCSAFDTYVEVYSYSTYCRGYRAVTCGSGNRCEVGLCRCDSNLAYCLRRSYFNRSFRFWWDFKC